MAREKDAKFKPAAADPIDTISVMGVHFPFDGTQGAEPLCNVTLGYFTASGQFARSSPQITLRGEAFNKVIDAIRRAGAVKEGETHASKLKQAVLAVAAEEGLLPEDVVPL